MFLCLYREFWLINVYCYANKCTYKEPKINIASKLPEDGVRTPKHVGEILIFV
jgi:hypothetical protein